MERTRETQWWLSNARDRSLRVSIDVQDLRIGVSACAVSVQVQLDTISVSFISCLCLQVLLDP